jgi:hypothetical protein
MPYSRAIENFQVFYLHFTLSTKIVLGCCEFLPIDQQNAVLTNYIIKIHTVWQLINRKK